MISDILMILSSYLLRLPVPGIFKSIPAKLVVLNSHLNLCIGVHHKRSILHDRLIQRQPTNQNKSKIFSWAFKVAHRHAVPRAAQNQGVVSRNRGLIFTRRPRTKHAFSVNHVDKRVPVLRYGLVQLRTGFHCEI